MGGSCWGNIDREREARNAHDGYAVAVKMTGATDIVGHFHCVNYSLWKYSVSLIFVVV